MNEEIRTLDLFSGIGGFSLGLERAGPFRTVAFCEQDQFAQRVLKKHWPEVPIFEDVRSIPTDALGRIDLICGGPPCQPWSVAGHQRGAEDDRDLWPAMVALVEKLRPQFTIIENVRGFVNEPMGLARTLADLERIGYQSVTFLIPAAAVGARHRRDRCWVVAHDDGQRTKCRVGYVRKSRTGRRRVFSGYRENVADTDDTGLQGCEQRQASGEGPWTSRSVTKCGEDGRLYGWLPEPDVGRVAHGVPNRVDRLKCLGNAVVPAVVEQIGRAILEGHR